MGDNGYWAQVASGFSGKWLDSGSCRNMEKIDFKDWTINFKMGKKKVKARVWWEVVINSYDKEIEGASIFRVWAFK